MLLPLPLTISRIVKLTQLVLSGIVVTKEVVDMFRNSKKSDD